MIKYIPVKYTELKEPYSSDSSLSGYFGYDLSDEDRECGKCIFRINGYSMEILSVESNSDDETVEGFIRSALNYGANRNAYIAFYKAENGIKVADMLGFQDKGGVLTGEIPELLAGSCCKNNKKF